MAHGMAASEGRSTEGTEKAEESPLFRLDRCGIRPATPLLLLGFDIDLEQ